MSPVTLIYVLFFLVGGYAIVFGGARFHQGGVIGRLHFVLTQGICTATWTAFELWLPAGIVQCASRWSDWLTEQRCGHISGFGGPSGVVSFAFASETPSRHPSVRNPVVQSFYVALFATGLGIYYRDVRQWQTDWVKSLVILLVVACIALFVTMCLSDPGRLSRHNVGAHLSRYGYDGVLFVRGRSCETCEITKPARSKHCRICKTCIWRHDHHCVWINNCVGGRNYGLFLAFLLANAFLLSVASYTAYVAFVSMARVARLSEAYVLDERTRKPVPIDSVRIAQYLAQEKPLLASMLVCLGCVAVVLWGFFAYHMRLAVSNRTTNEASKLEVIRERRATSDGVGGFYDRGVVRNVTEAVFGN